MSVYRTIGPLVFNISCVLSVCVWPRPQVSVYRTIGPLVFDTSCVLSPASGTRETNQVLLAGESGGFLFSPHLLIDNRTG